MIDRLTLITLTLAVAIEARGQAPPSKPVGLPQSYLLRGTVRDSVTGAPVSNARIWPYLKGWGVVSDEQGTYQLRWQGRAVETLIVRLCDDRNITTLRVDFFRDSVVQQDILISPSVAHPCTSSDRVPWAVDARDTTRFRGHYTYSWEGGGWLEACGRKTFSPDWDSVLGSQLRQRQKREGQVSFVRFQGRVAPDHLGVIFPGPIYLVSTVEEVRDPRPDDCR